MREIKFRVWDKVKNEWFSVKNAMAFLLNNDNKENLVFITKDGPYPIPQTDQDLGGRNRFEIQQFTGLLDKNGVEMYEGDIVLIPATEDPEDFSNELNVIIFKNGAFRFDNAMCYEELLQDWISFSGTCDFKVIGNIFENPELI